MGQLSTGNLDHSTHRVVVIQKHTPAPPPGMRKEAFVFGVLTGVFLVLGLIILYFGLMSRLGILCLALAAFAWPAYKLRRDHRMIADARGAGMIGAYYAFGMSSAIFIGFACIVFVDILGSVEGIFFDAIIIAITSSAIAAVFLVFAIQVSIAILWSTICLTLPKFIVQDGTLCPNCAYCLIGTQSMRCPECGNEFSFDDLETTAEEFASRAVTSN